MYAYAYVRRTNSRNAHTPRSPASIPRQIHMPVSWRCNPGHRDRAGIIIISSYFEILSPRGFKACSLPPHTALEQNDGAGIIDLITSWFSCLLGFRTASRPQASRPSSWLIRLDYPQHVSVICVCICATVPSPRVIGKNSASLR